MTQNGAKANTKGYGKGAKRFLFTRKQFCSCVRPVTLIYCVKMVTFFFSFVCQKPKCRMLVYMT